VKAFEAAEAAGVELIGAKDIVVVVAYVVADANDAALLELADIVTVFVSVVTGTTASGADTSAARAMFVEFRLPPFRNAGTSVWLGPGTGSGKAYESVKMSF